MIDAVRSEWIKLRSVRSNIVTFVAAVVIVGLGAVLGARSATPGDVQAMQVNVATAGIALAQVLFGVLGVQIVGQEYRFNTIRATFAAVPLRRRVLVAKLAVIVATTVAFCVVALALSVLAARAIVGPSLVLDGTSYRVLLGAVGLGAAWAAIGFSVGAIVRQPVAAIMLLLGWALVAENLISSLVRGAARWMPFANGAQMMRYSTESALRSPATAALLLLAVTTALVAAGLVLAQRRDA